MVNGSNALDVHYDNMGYLYVLSVEAGDTPLTQTEDRKCCWMAAKKSKVRERGGEVGEGPRDGRMRGSVSEDRLTGT